jgi:hypothetical protein
MTMPQSVCRYWLVTQTSSPLARSTGRRKTGTLVGSNAPDECNCTPSGSIALHYRVSVAQSSCQCILRFRGAESQSCPTHPQRNQTTARSVRCTPKGEIERVSVKQENFVLRMGYHREGRVERRYGKGLRGWRRCKSVDRQRTLGTTMPSCVVYTMRNVLREATLVLYVAFFSGSRLLMSVRNVLYLSQAVWFTGSRQYLHDSWRGKLERVHGLRAQALPRSARCANVRRERNVVLKRACSSLQQL